MENLLGISVPFEGQPFRHDLGNRLRNAEGRDHQKNKIYILGILEQSKALASQRRGKRALVQHADDF